ncbi:hypothetical protein AB0L82_35290 [Nocardia sp. NPDC052001]|uniref:hypothetical protein n=1 Tax=Nocardia sp. NPDC052001 TaxID=3154853 RepID=UPI00341C5B4A
MAANLICAAVALGATAGCGGAETASTASVSPPVGVSQDYATLSCITAPEDLRWEYAYLYDSSGHLKSFKEIQSMPVDQELGQNPPKDVTSLYKALESRYGHPPACGEQYPRGTAGQLNVDALNHKALSCADIPADLKQKYPALFDSAGRLKSWLAIESSAIPSANDSLQGDITSLYNQVVSRLGHPVSCPEK